MITIYKDRLNVNYLEYIFTSIFLFIVLGLYYIFIPIERKIYFKLNNDEIKKLS